MLKHLMPLGLAILLVCQFLIIALHDWVPIGSLSRPEQVQAVVGRRRLLIATVVNSVFPGIAVLLAVRGVYVGHSDRLGHLYILAYTTITLASAILMWWIPYLAGASAKTCADYQRMYAGTTQLLPARGNHPRPNLLHILFHALFLTTFSIAALTSLG